ESIKEAGAYPCLSLEDAARKAVALARGEEAVTFDGFDADEAEIDQMVEQAVSRLKPEQKYLRGLYTGGTLTDEAIKYLGENHAIYSNIPLTPDRDIEHLENKQGHICLDLGEDQFTRGRPHPMIDPQTRTDFFDSHVDETTAIILVDVVLGYGSYSDPAGAVAESLEKARERVGDNDFIVVASVTGTDQDPQDLNESIKTLENAGAIVMPSNAQAVRLVDRIMKAAAL
ncbi:MAG: FdrA family protein, partial [Clostridiaceae bacterium]|nr:FdrA family protein [Clostridiaceae bacterium]